MEDQSLRTAGSGCVVERYGLWPARESIYHCEEVGETVGRWQWSYKVHMNMVESVLRDAELLEWGFDLLSMWSTLYGIGVTLHFSA